MQLCYDKFRLTVSPNIVDLLPLLISVTHLFKSIVAYFRLIFHNISLLVSALSFLLPPSKLTHIFTPQCDACQNTPHRPRSCSDLWRSYLVPKLPGIGFTVHSARWLLRHRYFKRSRLAGTEVTLTGIRFQNFISISLVPLNVEKNMKRSRNGEFTMVKQIPPCYLIRPI